MTHGDSQRKHKEEERHSTLMKTNFQEDLMMLEEWLINRRIGGEYCMKVAHREWVLGVSNEEKSNNYEDMNQGILFEDNNKEKVRIDNSEEGMLKNLARDYQFNFDLIKLRKFELPHQRRIWRC